MKQEHKVNNNGLTVDKLDDILETTPKNTVENNKDTFDIPDTVWTRSCTAKINPTTGLYFPPEGLYWEIKKDYDSLVLKLKRKGKIFNKTIDYTYLESTKVEIVLDSAAYLLHNYEKENLAADNSGPMFEVKKYI
jgi:hypothetical protein